MNIKKTYISRIELKFFMCFLFLLLLPSLVGGQEGQTSEGNVAAQLQKLISQKTVMVTYNPGVQGALPLDLTKRKDFELLKSLISSFNQGLVKHNFRVIDPDFLGEFFKKMVDSPPDNLTAFHSTITSQAAKHEASYYITLTLNVSDNARSDSVNELKVTLSAKLYHVGTAQFLKEKKSLNRKKYKNNEDTFNMLSQVLGVSTKQLSNKLAEGLIAELQAYLDDGMPLLLRLQGGTSRQKSRFRKMLKSLDQVTRLEDTRRNQKELFMRVYGKDGNLKELLEKIEEYFYLNPGFDGYELELNQLGDVVTLTLLKEGVCGC